MQYPNVAKVPPGELELLKRATATPLSPLLLCQPAAKLCRNPLVHHYTFPISPGPITLNTNLGVRLRVMAAATSHRIRPETLASRSSIS